jgi:hypothetical protein
MPGADSLPSQFQLLFWGMIGLNATLTGLAGWFLKRYIDRKDQRDDKVIDRLTEHDRRSMDHTIKIESIVGHIKTVALDFKRDQLEYQRQVHAEFSSLHREVLSLRGGIHEAQTSAEVLNEKLTNTKKEMFILYDAVQAHSKSLSLGAQTIARLDTDIKTIYKRLGPNSTLVSQVNVPKKPSNKD